MRPKVHYQPEGRRTGKYRVLLVADTGTQLLGTIARVNRVGWSTPQGEEIGPTRAAVAAKLLRKHGVDPAGVIV